MKWTNVEDVSTFYALCKLMLNDDGIYLIGWIRILSLLFHLCPGGLQKVTWRISLRALILRARRRPKLIAQLQEYLRQKRHLTVNLVKHSSTMDCRLTFWCPNKPRRGLLPTRGMLLLRKRRRRSTNVKWRQKRSRSQRMRTISE